MQRILSIFYVSVIISVGVYYFISWLHDYETKNIIELSNKTSIVTIEKELASFRSHEYQKYVDGKLMDVTDEMRCVRANFEDKVSGKSQTQYVYLNVQSKFAVIVSE
jgi:hypothetical protein